MNKVSFMDLVAVIDWQLRRIQLTWPWLIPAIAMRTGGLGLWVALDGFIVDCGKSTHNGRCGLLKLT